MKISKIRLLLRSVYLFVERWGRFKMSIDNGVYILKNKKGYRVTECQAIENIYGKIGLLKTEVEHYFGKSKYFKTAYQAHKEAQRL
jgi:hypothetical protein